MALEFQKVFPSDYPQILPLLEKFETAGALKEKFPLLFQYHWPCSIDFCGVMIEDEGKVIAYLGLVFSDRLIQGKPEIFANLTTLIIDSDYRGQKLTHRIVQYLQSLGDFSLTAITPIPSLYSMYKSNGFRDLLDHRVIFWKSPFLVRNPACVLHSDPKEIAQNLTGESLRIFNDHQAFHCDLLLFKKGNESAMVVLKDIKGQRRKFITNRWISYMDWTLRKFLRLDLLSTTMVCKEIHYCDNYAFLLSEWKGFLALAYPLLQVSAICVKKEQVLRFAPTYGLSSEFNHSRQMFFSKSVSNEDYDGLYSELFVMDM